jgi:hypothetical protein
MMAETRIRRSGPTWMLWVLSTNMNRKNAEPVLKMADGQVQSVFKETHYPDVFTS